jgi:hypothetical protein
MIVKSAINRILTVINNYLKLRILNRRRKQTRNGLQRQYVGRTVIMKTTKSTLRPMKNLLKTLTPIHMPP